mmetsp:Transcript_6533/g.15896  ORF Transcript_6533/g.15896 Transcript_6533/m.15896 type:complete len:203 (-) Transcript_6533:89-697(-)
MVALRRLAGRVHHCDEKFLQCTHQRERAGQALRKPEKEGGSVTERESKRLASSRRETFHQLRLHCWNTDVLPWKVMDAHVIECPGLDKVALRDGNLPGVFRRPHELGEFLRVFFFLLHARRRRRRHHLIRFRLCRCCRWRHVAPFLLVALEGVTKDEEVGQLPRAPVGAKQVVVEIRVAVRHEEEGPLRPHCPPAVLVVSQH